MNWKKEGYKKGQEVFIVCKQMFTDKATFHKGEVSYIGTKILKVKIEAEEKELKFNNSIHADSVMFGYGYEIYKTKAQYEEKERKIQYRYTLRKKVQDGVVKLSNEQLEEILKWIEEKKHGK